MSKTVSSSKTSIRGIVGDDGRAKKRKTSKLAIKIAKKHSPRAVIGSTGEQKESKDD